MSQTSARPMGRRAGGPPGMGMGMPTEKAAAFWPTIRRAGGRLKPFAAQIWITVALSVVSTVLGAFGPLLLGDGTNAVFAGVVSGRGIDFGVVGHWLLLALLVYVGSQLFGYIQSLVLNVVVQRFAYRFREDVEAKLHRLPLSYLDRVPRGELLSRVTNDIDNVAQTMQQTLSQLLNSLLSLIGVLIMMFVVSWQLALIALIVVPVSVLVTTLVARRSQKMFVQNWKIGRAHV